MIEPIRVNPMAEVTYSKFEGFTVVNGTTVNGIEILHAPTKDEPYTDVFVVIRAFGKVTIQ